MPLAEASVSIMCPAAEVFAFLDDTARAPQWLELCTALEQRSPGPKAVGTALAYSYRQGARPGHMDGLVTAYEPGAALGMRFTDPKFTVQVDFLLGPGLTGTEVHHRIDITPASLVGRLMSPFIQFGNRRQVANNLDRLKHLLESASAQKASATRVNGPSDR